jgi:hypothetical protein
LSAASVSLGTGVGTMPQFFSSVGNSKSLKRAPMALVFGRVWSDEHPRALAGDQFCLGALIVLGVELREVFDPALFDGLAQPDAAGCLGL